MKKTLHPIVLTLLWLIIAQSGFSQKCGTFEYENYLNTKFPGYANALSQTRQQGIVGMEKLSKAGNDTIYRVPVVFHIVWNTKVQNIPDSLIYSQLDALNESYRHVHKDTGKVRSIFKPVVGDSRIEFYLATIGPDGKPTNGIDRFKTTASDFGDSRGMGESVKSSFEYGVDAWNPDKYLNIWVCKFTYNGTLAITAYAFPPTNAKFWTSASYVSTDLQGVVINYQYVGKNNPNTQDPSSLKERTLVHEVGHFFGLRHIWADKNNTCIGEDDGIKDTPLCKAANRTCGTNYNSCIEGTGDKPDMTENYMDYAAFPCTVMFTQQQVQLMRFNLITLRPQLYSLKTSLPPPPIYSKITVSPNPAKGDIRIIFDLQGNYKMSLTDIIGQPVASEEFSVGYKLEHTCSTALSAGIYYITVTDSNNLITKQRILVK